MIHSSRMPELKGLDMDVVQITEKALNRILDGHSEDGYIIVSAFRNNKTREENLESNFSLMGEIHNNKFNYMKLFGGFIESLEDKSNKVVKELAFLVPNFIQATTRKYENTVKLRQMAVDLCCKYEQEGVLYKAKGEIPPVYLNRIGGINIAPTNSISLDNLSQEYFTNIEKDSSGRLHYSGEIFLMKAPETMSGRFMRMGEILISKESLVG